MIMTSQARNARNEKLSAIETDIENRRTIMNERMDALGLSMEERKELSWFSEKDINAELERLESNLNKKDFIARKRAHLIPLRKTMGEAEFEAYAVKWCRADR